MFEKQEEFFAWLSEVKGVPQEACGQRELKEVRACACARAYCILFSPHTWLRAHPPARACHALTHDSRAWRRPQHFSSFVEDYNTATFPNDKYYDLRKWYVKEQVGQA